VKTATPPATAPDTASVATAQGEADVRLLGDWPASEQTIFPREAEFSSNRSRFRARFATASRKHRLRPPAVVGLLVLTALVLMLLDLRSGPTDHLRAVGLAVGGPAQEWADNTLGPVFASPLLRPDTAELEARITDLESENADLEIAKAQALDAAAAARARLAERSTNKTLGLTAVPARVVAVGRSGGPGNSATISLGSRSDVAVDMAVLAQGALVGKVVQVGPDSSTVRLITDPLSQVFAAESSSRTAGVVVGTGQALQVSFVKQFATLEVGGKFVTVGSKGGFPYPPGIPIAQVSAVPQNSAEANRVFGAEPIADIGALDVVSVVTDSGSA
jgi:rod shape-determining protein MreC